MAGTMLSTDGTIGALGKAYVTIDGERYLWASLINFKSTSSKNKVKLPIMGQMAKGNLTTSVELTGSATFHYNNSLLRRLMIRLEETGEDFYFDIQTTNEHPTKGRQTVIHKGCNIDSMTMANLDADAEYLEDDFDFTYEKTVMPEEFASENGMM